MVPSASVPLPYNIAVLKGSWMVKLPPEFAIGGILETEEFTVIVTTSLPGMILR